MSVEKQLEAYCEKHKEVWHSAGALQRVTWYNDDKTLAVPRSIVRRLQEMENERVLAVKHEGPKHTAWYRWIPPDWRSRYNTLVEREEKNLGMWNEKPTRINYHQIAREMVARFDAV